MGSPSLRQVDGKVEGVDTFLKTAHKYEDLVFSVGWLNVFIHQHPQVSVRISYVLQKMGSTAILISLASMSGNQRCCTTINSGKRDAVSASRKAVVDRHFKILVYEFERFRATQLKTPLAADPQSP